MKLFEYPDKASLMRKLAQVLEQDLAQALEQQGEVSFAVPGGTTPGPLFDVLSEAPLAWERVHVILTDERWVPQTDAQSNAGLIRKRLLVNRASAARFTPYFDASATMQEAAAARARELATALPIDVLLLGMGADMHTASLFPQAKGLEAAMADDAPMLLPLEVPGHEIARFSLSAPALRGARQTHLLITGDDKRAALERARTLPALDAPVGVVLDNAIVHWSAA